MSRTRFNVITDFRILEKTESIEMGYRQYCKFVDSLLNQDEFFQLKPKFLHCFDHAFAKDWTGKYINIIQLRVLVSN